MSSTRILTTHVGSLPRPEALLGPLVAKQELGGAGPWALVLTLGGIGSVVGSVVAMRVRPARPLVACTLAAVPLSFQLVALALVVPVPVLAVTSFVAGIGISIHLTLWFTLFQRAVPDDVRSRVSSYDTFGSFVLMPLGMALAGLFAGVGGTVLLAGVGIIWATGSKDEFDTFVEKAAKEPAATA